MACQHETSQHRSALEFEIRHETTAGLQLVRHDPTANAPERDHDIDAPECDLTYAIPQVALGQGLEVTYDRSLPEVVTADTFPPKNTPAICGLETKKFWRLFFVVLFMFVAIAVGTSVGIGARTSASHDPPSSTSSVSTASTPTTPPQPSNTPNTVRRTILSGSALAAVTLSNGDRRLFYQDSLGAIRESLYTISNEQWTANVNGIVATDAKNNTPLAAFKFPNPSDQTYLFYIALNNSFALRASVRDSWVPPSTDFSNFVAADESRFLYATLSPVDAVPSGAFVASLRFQAASGQQKFLKLESGIGLGRKWLTDYVDIEGTSQRDRCDYGTLPELDVPEPSTVLVPLRPFPSNFDLTQVSVSKGANMSVNIYVLAVNGTLFESKCHIIPDKNETVHADPDLSSPTSPFPFAKLAATSLRYSSVFHMYHQINNTTFAEDIYDIGKGDWTSTNFSIPVT